MLGAIVGTVASKVFSDVASDVIGSFMGGGKKKASGKGTSKADLEAQHEKNMKEQYAMMALQDKMAQDNIIAQTISNIQKSMSDTKKGIVANLK